VASGPKVAAQWAHLQTLHFSKLGIVQRGQGEPIGERRGSDDEIVRTYHLSALGQVGPDAGKLSRHSEIQRDDFKLGKQASDESLPAELSGFGPSPMITMQQFCDGYGRNSKPSARLDLMQHIERQLFPLRRHQHASVNYQKSPHELLLPGGGWQFAEQVVDSLKVVSKPVVRPRQALPELAEVVGG
jgi:hypothetical protein